MISVTSRSYVTENGTVIFKGRQLPVAKKQQNLKCQQINDDTTRLSVRECLYSLVILVVSSAIMAWIISIVN